MFAENKSVNALGANIECLGEHPSQAGGIQPDAGAYHLAARESGQLPDLPGNNIAGVGGHQKDTVEAVAHHRWNDTVHDFGRGVQLVKAALALFQRSAGNGNHRDIDIGTLADVPR